MLVLLFLCSKTGFWRAAEELIDGKRCETLRVRIDARGHHVGLAVVVVHSEIVTGFVGDEDAAGGRRGSEANVVDTGAVAALAHRREVGNSDGSTRIKAGETLQIVVIWVVGALVGCDAGQVIGEVRSRRASHVGILDLSLQDDAEGIARAPAGGGVAAVHLRDD